ncbi:MAG: hypothetical protein J0L66_15315 [Cytophagales bacterium]|nr:hypothetical protein [Cytophagales bacterium]
MKNVELIEEYLTNKLPKAERIRFEEQVASDPSLKADVEFQRQIIEGLKNARIAELKAMLNNVPVGTSIVTQLKIAAGLVGGALLVGSLYWFSQTDNRPEVTTHQSDPAFEAPADDSFVQPLTELQSEKAENTASETVTPAEVKVARQPETKQNLTKPQLQVVDPSSELAEGTSSPPNHGEVTSKPIGASEPLHVTFDSANRKYKFHYQFTNDKVVLYGSFDKSLYEVIELNGGSHSIYLYYQNKYYLLSETATAITPLEALTDKKTIQQLENIRKR